MFFKKLKKNPQNTSTRRESFFKSAESVSELVKLKVSSQPILTGV